MRAIVAAALLAGMGTGCCKTCDWCRDDAPVRANSGTTTQPPLESPPVGTGTTTTPPAPAGRPVGAYGGTGN